MHTRQGFYADPIYGGNKGRVGWQVIGFPGPTSLNEVFTGRYSTLAWFAEGHQGRRQRAWLRRKPRAAEVCIIGAGASGAAAAKVLTESGVKVVGLERGPGATREPSAATSSPTSTATISGRTRCSIRARPRTTADEAPRVELFCPVPQMVGGGTVHWQGWLPRFTPNDFRLRTIAGELPGHNARRLADHL